MSAANFVTINKLLVDSTGVEFRFNGRPYTITGISYDDELAPGEVKALSTAQQVGTTIGEYKANGQMKLLFGEFNKLVEELGKQGYGEKVNTITLSYQAPGEQPKFDTLHGVRIKKISNDAQPGSAANEVSIDLYVNIVERNGATLISNPRF